MAASPSSRRGPGFKAYALALGVTVSAGLAVGVGLGAYLSPGEPAASASPGPGGGLGFSLLPRLREPMNLLLMASDVNFTLKDGKRVMGLHGNTDTMMLVRFDPSQAGIRLLSIPRDTRVPIPGHGTFKINAANPYGGPALAAQTVADFLGVPVDRYLLLNTYAVKQIIDAMGGIDVYVPKNLHYHDRAGGLNIELRKGLNHLDGQQAHDFLRFRHDELGDIGRVQRQQAFMEAVMAQYMSPVNLLKTPQLLGIAKENLETNLSAEEMANLVAWAKDMSKDDVELSMVPGRAAPVGGVSFWLPDEEATRKVVASFLTASETAEAQPASSYKVAVRDGVGAPRAYAALRKHLQTLGYADVQVDRWPTEQGQLETQIIAQKADTEGAKRLADALGLGKVVVTATGNIYTDFTVVMGQDWVDRQAAAKP